LGSSWLIVHGSWPEKSGKRKDQSTGAFVVHGSWFMVHSSWFMAGDELKAERPKLRSVHGSWFMAGEQRKAERPKLKRVHG